MGLAFGTVLVIVVIGRGLQRTLHAAGLSWADRFAGSMRGGLFGGTHRKNWYDMSPEERRYHQQMRSPWWALPTLNTLDRATSMLPRLYHELGKLKVELGWLKKKVVN